MTDIIKNTRFSSFAPSALIMVSLFWGVTFPWVKKALYDFSPLYWIAYRFALASLLFGIIYIMRKKSLTRGLKEGLLLGSILGASFIMQTIGIKLSSAATMGLLTGLILPFIFLFETLVAKKYMERKLKLCLLLAFLGFMLLSYEGGMKLHSADLLGVLSSFGFALQIFLTGRYAPRSSILTLNFYQMLAVSAIGFTGAALFEDHSALRFDSLVAVSSIVFTAVFCSFFAYIVQTWAQRFVSPAKTTLLFSLEPLFAAIVSWMIYYEEITAVKIIGAILLLSSVAAVQVRRKDGDSRSCIDLEKRRQGENI